MIKIIIVKLLGAYPLPDFNLRTWQNISLDNTIYIY